MDTEKAFRGGVCEPKKKKRRRRGIKTMPKMAHQPPNVVRARLVTSSSQPNLGMLLTSRPDPPRTAVRALLDGSEAKRCGLIHPGDVIVKVNDVDVSDFNSQKVSELLNAIPAGGSVVLLVQGPEGYTTYLHTVFSDCGQPKTYRVTAPIEKRSFPTSSTVNRSKQQTQAVNNTIETVNKNNNNVQKESTYGNVHTSAVNPIPEDQGKLVSIQRKEKSLSVCMNGQGVNHNSTIVNNDVKSQSTETEVEKEKEEPRRKNQSSCVALEQETRSTSPCRNRSTSPVPATSELSPHKLPEGVSGHRRGSRRLSSVGLRPAVMSSPTKRSTKLTNIMNHDISFNDTLHTKAPEFVASGCNGMSCAGSIMMCPPPVKTRDHPRPKEEVLSQAKDFIDQYYTVIKRYNTSGHQQRWAEVEKAIEKKGTYELTTSELTFGAKTAWRNAARCIGRIQWSKLQVFDARHIQTARGMFEACCNHIKYATNKGNIRSAITIFPPRTDGQHDFRVWSAQMIRYAGYKQPDGSVIGDPANVEFTEICQKMGWKGKGGMFDVLPLVLQANGADPELFEIPPDLVLEVAFKHPEYDWFEELGLRWYALPAVANMMLDCGGLEFTAIPFNGWYMGTEIGARDLCDSGRYNMLEPVAKKMGLDTMKSASLWKDKALVEVNVAVLYSYQQQRVTITDHHAASESFIKHCENEQRLRGGCPADWVWVVPPMSSSITPVFHQEMLRYHLKPSFEYQDEPWKTHTWKKDRIKGEKRSEKRRKKLGFRDIARAVKFSAKLMGKALAKRIKCTILYGTETGKSETFAKRLCQIFKHAFDAKVMCMDEYDIIDLEHEALVLVVTSTFGNGDPPENGEMFANSLYEMTDNKRGSLASLRIEDGILTPERRRSKLNGHLGESLDFTVGPLGNVRYSVFGLGSRAYPNFCAFAKLVDRLFQKLGGERLLNLGEGDELCGQEQAFNTWAEEVFKEACETFCVGEDLSVAETSALFAKVDMSWSPGKFRLTPVDNHKQDLCRDLGKIHHRNVFPCRLIERTNLHNEGADRETILLRFDTNNYNSELSYVPGDHLGIYAANKASVVDRILAYLMNAPPPDQMVLMEVLTERTTPLGSMKSWSADERLPSMTVRTALTNYLDVTTPPPQTVLKQLAAIATDDDHRKALERLATDAATYEEWKLRKYPTVADVLDEFPSLRVSPSLLLSQLPLLQPRFYSISSSPKMYPGEIHATVAVVTFRTHDEDKSLRHGICSTWLNEIAENEMVPCFVRGAPSFHLPEEGNVPVIMVGPGTGIAPFRSFWQQRRVDREMLQPPSAEGWESMTMYFGCRRSDRDFLYEEEMNAAKMDNVLTDVRLALSREPGLPKKYVQDLIMEDADAIFKAVDQKGGHFFVCGDVQMAHDVTSRLEQIIMDKGDMTADQAKQYVVNLRDTSRFHEDIFGVTLRTHEVQNKARRQVWKQVFDMTHVIHVLKDGLH